MTRTRVQSGERSNRATNPSGSECCGAIHDGAIVSTLWQIYISPIEYHDIMLIYARVVDIPNFIVDMTHKHVRNNMGRETIDNLV